VLGRKIAPLIITLGVVVNITEIEKFTKDVIMLACQLENAKDVIKRIIRVGELKAEYTDPANKMMMIAKEYLDDAIPENKSL